MYPGYEETPRTRSKLLVILILVFVLGAALFFLYPTLEDRVLLPQPSQAWVAIEVAESGVARVGRIEVEAGTPFTLHAVLEAEGRGGPVYYTTAEGLEVDGEVVPAEQLRRWDRPYEPRIRWFSVEGSTPYLEVESAAAIVQQLRFEELFRPDWPSAWAIPGRLEPMGGKASEVASVPFGTQRYHVRIELYRDDKALIPEERYRSWGAEALPEQWETFPGVTAYLPGALRPASGAFGLTQVEAAATAPIPEEILSATVELNRRAVAFSRLGVVHRTIATTGQEPAALVSQDLELQPPPAWGETVQAGDLLQAGERIVVLYEDRGELGVLDGEDQVIDFYRGASLRRLDEVFSGSGIVSWLPMRPAS
jgi:hypothetical protein